MKRQIISCIDLVQEEARYHDGGRAKFTSGKHAKFTAQQKGRPQNNIQQSNYKILCEWLEREYELYSLAELQNEGIC